MLSKWFEIGYHGSDAKERDKFNRWRDDEPDSEPEDENNRNDNDHGRYLGSVDDGPLHDGADDDADLFDFGAGVAVSGRQPPADQNGTTLSSPVADGPASDGAERVRSVPSNHAIVRGLPPLFGHTISPLAVSSSGSPSRLLCFGGVDASTAMLTTTSYIVDDVRDAAGSWCGVVATPTKTVVKSSASSAKEEVEALRPRMAHCAASFPRPASRAAASNQGRALTRTENSVVIYGGLTTYAHVGPAQHGSWHGEALGDAMLASLGDGHDRRASVTLQRLRMFNAPAPRFHASMVWWPSKKRFLMFGGTLDGRRQADCGVLYSVHVDADERAIEFHDLATVGTRPESRWGHASTLLGGGGGDEDEVLVVNGGVAEGNRVLDSTFVLQCATRVWREVFAPLTLYIPPRAFHCIAPVGPSSFVIVGGDFCGKPTDSWQCDVAKSWWTSLVFPVLHEMEAQAVIATAAGIAVQRTIGQAFSTSLEDSPSRSNSVSSSGTSAGALAFPASPIATESCARAKALRIDVVAAALRNIGSLHGALGALVTFSAAGNASITRVPTQWLLIGGTAATCAAPASRLHMIPSLRQQAALIVATNNLAELCTPLTTPQSLLSDATRRRRVQHNDAVASSEQERASYGATAGSDQGTATTGVTLLAGDAVARAEEQRRAFAARHRAEEETNRRSAVGERLTKYFATLGAGEGAPPHNAQRGGKEPVPLRRRRQDT